MRGKKESDLFSIFSAMLPALLFSLVLAFNVVSYISAVYLYSPSFHLLLVPSSLLSPFLPSPLFVSLFLFPLYPIIRVSLLRRVRPCARTCASKRSNAPASQHGPAPSSCIAVSLDLHDPHESPRDSLPTSERKRKAKRYPAI